MKPVHLAILWHQHQPFYKDPISQTYAMPWVRLHAVKDYLDMLLLLKDYPDLRQNFNLVPSLMTQIMDYSSEDVKDLTLAATMTPAELLTENQKIYILKNFFMANWDQIIHRYPPYERLLQKRGHFVNEPLLKQAATRFTTQDWLDLQCWFNLAWTDPSFIEISPELREMASGNRHFTEADKILILDRHREIIRRILPTHRDMQQEGRIEVSTSPFYHPILPLLCDTDSARTAIPNIDLPAERFRHPEDALTQLRKARLFYENIFHCAPAGLWPSEGSVSEEILPMIRSEGFQWIASDEEILAASLSRAIHRDGSGHVTNPDLLYRPYWVGPANDPLAMVFRDHTLSDLIGFVYSRWKPQDAAHDLIRRLKNIQKDVQSLEGDRLVTIILDGENAWEYYPNDGNDFLRSFYALLQSEKDNIRTVTIGQYIHDHPPDERIDKLFSGSWINHNYRIWIGHNEDNDSWMLLKKTRDALTRYMEMHPEEHDSDRLRRAWEEIYIAEGSDWNWWYGDDHSTPIKDEFDSLYRHHLMLVYESLGIPPDPALLNPLIREDNHPLPFTPPRGLIHPTIDGEITNYYEWIEAGHYDPHRQGSTMHQAEFCIEGIYFGFDLNTIFLRIDPRYPFTDEWASSLDVELVFMNEHSHRLNVVREGSLFKTIFSRQDQGDWKVLEANDLKLAVARVLELAIPFETLQVHPKDTINLMITIKNLDSVIEKWPAKGKMEILIPGTDFETINWQV